MSDWSQQQSSKFTQNVSQKQSSDDPEQMSTVASQHSVYPAAAQEPVQKERVHIFTKLIRSRKPRLHQAFNSDKNPDNIQ